MIKISLVLQIAFKPAFLLMFTTFLFSIVSNGQTGPGGVGSSATNPLWLDAHTMGGVNGAAISSFTDYSGNNIHAVQPVVAKRPTFVTSAVNGKAAINFSGTQNLTAPATITMNNVPYFEWYVVSEVDNFNILSTPFNVDYGSIPAQDVFAGFLTQNALPASSFSHDNVPQLKKANFPVSANYNMYEGIYNRTAHTVSAHTNFVQNSINVSNYYNTVTHQGFDIGGKNTSYRMDGKIAEVFVFNFALNTAQRKIMQNYIGAKYNIAIPTDLYAFQATHDLCVIGIGRDNALNMHSSAKGNGVLSVNTPSAMGDGEYLFVGHDDIPLTTLTSTDVPVSLPGYLRWSRTWRTDETGDVGTVTLTYDLSGGNDFGASNSYRLLVDNVTQNGDFSDANEVVGVYDGMAQTITFTLNLNSGDYFTIAAAPLEIHAIFDGLWSDPNTWDCLCIPSFASDVYIDPFIEVVVDIDAQTDYFSIEDPGSLLTMNTNQTLSIYGDWDILGPNSLNLTDGKIQLVGTVDQYVDAGGNTVNFNDLEIDNSGGTVTFYESEYILNGVFFPTLGSLTLDPTPGNQFIINSTSAGTTARIAPIGTSFTFNGTYTVRRFLPAGVAEFRDLASPVNGAQLWMWDNSIAISGFGFPDGCAFGVGGCFYSVQYYQNDLGIDVTNILDPLVVGRGYEVFIGDDLNTFSGATLEVKGTLNDGQNVVLNASANYSTLGNPYASPILWDDVTLSGVGNFFYVYDANTGAYEYYDGSDGSSSIPDLATGAIAMGQGFWVEGPGTVTITDASKTTSGVFIRNSTEDKSLTLHLKENASTYSSSIAIQQAGESSDAMDFLLDIPHLSTGMEKAPAIAMYSGDEQHIRKNYIKDDFRNKSFDLFTKILNAGYYTIEASNIEYFNNYLKVLLYDNVTGQFVNLKKEPTYTFYSDITEGHRFTLIFSNQDGENEESIQALTINEQIGNGLTITQMGHTFNIVSTEYFTEDSQIKLVNVLGQQEVFYQSIKFVDGSNMISVPDELKGVHILVITTGDKTVTKKVVL